MQLDRQAQQQQGHLRMEECCSSAFGKTTQPLYLLPGSLQERYISETTAATYSWRGLSAALHWATHGYSPKLRAM